MDERKSTARRARTLPVLLAFLTLVILAAGCIPQSGAPPSATPTAATAAPPGPRTDLGRAMDGFLHPTLVEYVHTMGVYQGDQAALDALVEDVFSVVPNPAHAAACLELGIMPRESTRSWWSVNRSSGAAGLTQLLGHGDLAWSLTGSTDVLNPWVNLVTARQLSGMGTNWSPWTPVPSPC